jgi:Ser/Thr protein kinase RdoA (MazF antagonist)
VSETSPDERVAPLRALALAALAHWPIEPARIEPLKMRENAVFAVDEAGGRRVVLRIHRRGYHSDEALRSEALWLDGLREHGIEVPRVVPSRAGRTFEVVEHVDGPRQVDVFEWIDGRQLGAVDESLAAEPEWIRSVHETVGEPAARIHAQSSAWHPPPGFRRHAWDREGLVGERPFWGRFWELEALGAAERRLFERLRAALDVELRRFGTAPDRFGLIHADLVPENVLVDGEHVRVIDFDDAGFGWHLFELATTLYFIRREPCYELARDALVAGYRRRRPLPDEALALLPAFLAARGTTYLGGVHTRQGEPVARELTPLSIDLAVAAAEDYLAAADR